MADFLDEMQKAFDKLGKYSLEIGVFTGKSRRKIQVGVTNAELMFIHEKGSPLQNIPARPVLQMTIDYANQNLLQKVVDKCVDYALIDDYTNIEIELNKFAMRLENYARRIIYSNDGRLAPNSPRTIARKGDNHPLFDTGQLARSITCRVVKS